MASLGRTEFRRWWRVAAGRQDSVSMISNIWCFSRLVLTVQALCVVMVRHQSISLYHLGFPHYRRRIYVEAKMRKYGISSRVQWTKRYIQETVKPVNQTFHGSCGIVFATSHILGVSCNNAVPGTAVQPLHDNCDIHIQSCLHRNDNHMFGDITIASSRMQYFRKYRRWIFTCAIWIIPVTYIIYIYIIYFIDFYSAEPKNVLQRFT